MPRQARLRLPGVPFHIVQRGHNRDACFRDDDDRLLYTGLLGKHRRLTGTSIHAYVLMTNHVHLLLTGESHDSISNLMKAVAQFHAQAVNRKYGLKGAHWEGRFRSSPVECDRYLFACMRYIEMNPVRAGIATGAETYPWSSHKCLANGERSAIVDPHEAYLALGATPLARQAAYRAIFGEAQDTSLISTIREAVNNGFALGSDTFHSRVSKETGLRTRPSRRGRPPKLGTVPNYFQ
jgi:putative transposase